MYVKVHFEGFNQMNVSPLLLLFFQYIDLHFLAFSMINYKKDPVPFSATLKHEVSFGCPFQLSCYSLVLSEFLLALST